MFYGWFCPLQLLWFKFAVLYYFTSHCLPSVQNIFLYLVISSPAGNRDDPHTVEDKTNEDVTSVQAPAPDNSATSAGSAYVEPLELKTQPSIIRKKAWLAWRENRREDRKWAFARLRDAFALQDADMIERWKNRMLELGYDDPDESMPSFEDSS